MSMRLLLAPALFFPMLCIAQGLSYEKLVVDERGLGPVHLGTELSSASALLGIDIEASSFHYGDDNCASYALGKSRDDWDIRFITVNRKIGKIDIFTSKVKTTRDLGVGSLGTAVTETYTGTHRVFPAHDASESTVQVRTVVGTILEFTGQRPEPIQHSTHAVEPPESVRYYSIGLAGVGSVEGCL